MTRINVVPPEELCRQHLLAEYRELPRIFPLAIAAMQRGEKPADVRNPREYVLGTGHVRFFYSRLHWLNMRFLLLVREMQSRGYATNFSEPYDLTGIPSCWCNDYQPTAHALEINRARIAARMPQ